MSTTKIPELMKEVRNQLSEQRFRHTLGVAYTSAALAMRYEEDTEKAFLAGLFHDIAKEYDQEETKRLCRYYNIPMESVEERNPVLLHGKLGAEIFKERFGEKDAEVLDAIRYHTTGRPGMTLLEKIVFTADYIEPLRERRVGDLALIRPLAFSDLDAAIIQITEETMHYLEARGKEIDRMTEDTHHYYKKQYGGTGTGRTGKKPSASGKKEEA